jgi:hypothetical protein
LTAKNRHPKKNGSQFTLKDAITLKFLEKISFTNGGQSPQSDQQSNKSPSNLNLTAEDRENERRVRELKDRKADTERQNQALLRIKDTDKLALLARYNEYHNTNHVETVRLP